MRRRRAPAWMRGRRKSRCQSALLGAAASLVAAGALPLGGAGAEPDPRALQLRSGRFDPARLAEPTAPAVSGRAAYLVQFEAPIRAEDRAALEAAGAAVKGYVPMQTLEVVMSPAARPAVASIPGVRWVGRHRADFKAAPGLLSRARDHEVAAGSSRFRVGLYPGEEESALAALVELGAEVLHVERGRSYSVAEVIAPTHRTGEILDLPLVRHLDPASRRRLLNDRQRAHSGVAALADDTFAAGLDPSLDGYDEASGFRVTYGHFDGGISLAHPDFQGAIVEGRLTAEPGADIEDTASGHGTHTAASIVGDGGQWSEVPETPPGSGAVSEHRWRGVQPQAALHHISFDNDYDDRQTFERLVEEGAQISTNSWSYCTLIGCAPIPQYDASAAAWDEAVWDADDDEPGQQPLLVLFSAGNDGNGGVDGCGAAGADTISTPATAKNIVTVGAHETDRGCNVIEDHVGDVAIFSSRGPVAPDPSGQGLFKPDLVATGTRVLSAEADGTGGRNADARNGPFACSDTGSSYAYKDGTSMACPHAAGVAGMVLQDLVVRRGVASPSPALLKALLIQGARALQPSGPCSYGFDTRADEVHQGWGRIRAPDSLYGHGGTPSARTVLFEDEFVARSVATGETRTVNVNVPAGGDLRVTLVWTDYPASPIAASPLVVNDLDLEVSGPEGLFLGNDFAGEWSVTSKGSGHGPDRYNVVENVYLQDVEGGLYRITVRGHQVAQDQEPEAPGVEQPYALVWSAPGPPPRCADGLDNDGDQRIDWDGGAAAGLPPEQRTDPDPTCVEKPWKDRENSGGCGLGYELALALEAFRRLRRRRVVPRPGREPDGAPASCGI